MDNPEKLAAYGTQDDEKQRKNTTQYVLDTNIRKQTQIRLYYKQLILKSDRIGNIN
jgi:hypothetical protein